MPERYIRNPNSNCFVCGKPIYRRPIEIKRGHIYCGALCYGVANRKEKPCLVCGKLILAGLNKKTCSRTCANSNRAGIKYKIGSPKDKVKSQHALKLRLINERGVKCERCTYDKYEILQVHHKDRNRNHNELLNLELICPNCHYEEHFLEKSWIRKHLEKTWKIE